MARYFMACAPVGWFRLWQRPSEAHAASEGPEDPLCSIECLRMWTTAYRDLRRQPDDLCAQCAHYYDQHVGNRAQPGPCLQELCPCAAFEAQG